MPTIDNFPSRFLFSYLLLITSLLGIYYNNVNLSRYKEYFKVVYSLEVEEMMDSNILEPCKNFPLKNF